MFNSNRGRDSGAPSLSSPSPAAGKRGMFSVLGPDVVVTGNIAATADLHIDGRVDGDVDCGALVLGPDSRVSGNVRAETARIAGAIAGTVGVHQLTVERTARITGDVEYENISIENGAKIDGRLKHITAESQRIVQAPVTPTLTAEPVKLLQQSDAVG